MIVITKFSVLDVHSIFLGEHNTILFMLKGSIENNNKIKINGKIDTDNKIEIDGRIEQGKCILTIGFKEEELREQVFRDYILAVKQGKSYLDISKLG